MCRLAAFNGLKKGDVLDILLDMEKINTDGFGFGYVNNGKFVVKKTMLSLSEVLKKKSQSDFFEDCFKHEGWVMYHMRRASRGGICQANAHPFVGKKFIFCHNGTLQNAELIKFAWGKSEKFTSSTDSEVALKLFEKMGIKRFSNSINDGGVFLALRDDGCLYAMKSNYSGDLKVVKLNKNKFFVASELPVRSDWDEEEMGAGFTLFDKNGGVIEIKEKHTYTPSSNSGNTNDVSCARHCFEHEVFRHASKPFIGREVTVYNPDGSKTISGGLGGARKFEPSDEDYYEAMRTGGDLFLEH